MKASITKGAVQITGKLEEEDKITKTYLQMMGEFNSMTLIEALGRNEGAEMVEVVLCFSCDEATVSIVKESYSEAKKVA